MSKVILKDVVMRVKDKVDKDTTELEYYIGGEHFDNGEVVVSKKGIIKDSTIGPAFHMRFKPGDVLLMSRNPHLRKAGVVDFEGICSDVSYVCRTRGNNVLSQKYLPFIFQSDHFWNFAEENKKGSTNFFLNWSDFEKYEFDLPSIEKQEELAEILWAAVNTKMAYQKLLCQTDELVKSQFIEMFDGVEKGFKEIPIIEACRNKNDIKCGPFGTQLKQAEYTEYGVPIWGIPQINSEFVVKPDAYVSAKKAEELDTYSLIPGDIAMSRKGNVGQCAIYPDSFEKGIIASDVLRIRIDKKRIIPKFMQYQLHHSDRVRQQIMRVSNGAVMAGVNVTKLKDIKVYIPPMELQEEFTRIVKQSDKSKFELKKSIEKLQGVIRTIQQQDLTD